ncbi:hypothetical protein ACFX1Q_024857 [Malus domestica]|uniref:uncharacterized protein n=1 Tax=Malus domestica TaxID=3750 RepID=UPI0039752E95
MMVDQKGGNFEPNPVPLCTDVPDGMISEKKKKKKKKKKKNKKKGNICDGVSDQTQDLSSVGVRDSCNSSKMSNCGFDDASSSSFLEVEVKDSKGGVSEGTETGTGRACGKNGKENRCLSHYWKMKREARKNWVKELGYRYGVKHVHPPQNQVWVEHDSFSGDGLLPSNNAAYGFKGMGHEQSSMHRRIPPRAFVGDESSQWVFSQQRLNGSFHRCVSQPSKFQGAENDCATSINLYRRENFNGKKEYSQVPFGMYHYQTRDTARRTFYHAHHVPSHGFRPYKLGKNPIMEHNFGRCSYASLDSMPYSQFRYHSDQKFRKAANSGPSSHQWKPVGTKESRRNDEIGSAGTCNALNLSLPVLSKELSDNHQEGGQIPFPSSDTRCTASISSHQLPSESYQCPKFYKPAAEIENQNIESNSYEANGRRPRATDEFLIGSQMAVEGLNASYRMQLASELVQLTMGCPLAEFERFIHCAAPVIASSYIHKKCSICLDDQMSHGFLCKHQIPNLSLRTVWNWYEKPGNYGLDVKADDSKNLNSSMPFHAYFVPYLSAVQLFQPQNSCSKTLNATHSSKAAELNHLQAGTEKHYGSVPLTLDCSPDSELIFEFFESEQPYQRKPFYNKILELTDVGTSNHHIFGDPSKLDCLNLHDLHPASWFSVAWYPIYRIPEGNLRATFLTYHSLGHFVRRTISVDPANKYASRIFCPVLGLQRYNAHGECWFEPKTPSVHSSNESTSNSVEILKEMLRTLDDNALRFGRGCVYKDHVMVSNRQPDYNFFSSRKAHYK